MDDTMQVTVGAGAALDSRAAYRALRARDPRFDGVFFVGVSSTGIYCRPVCRARLPRREHCSFFDTAAAAESAGYRPCLRCRPERAPGRSLTDATERLSAAAYERIQEGALNRDSVASLARDLCVGERQLRRAVKRRFGVTPVELAQTRRLLLAKQLLMETDLPVTRVAYSSGFSSVSRFNTLFRERYRLSPSRLRASRPPAGQGAAPTGPSDRSAAAAEADSTGASPVRAACSDAAPATTLRLDYRPPLAWRRLLAFLRPRAVPGVERVAGETYARTLALGGCVGWLEVRPAPGGAEALELRVSDGLAPVLMPLLARVRRLLDLDAEPEAVAAALRADRRLASLLERRPGLRVPGAMDGFELAARAVLGQQVSVRGATTLSGRFAAAFGEPAPVAPRGLDRLAPKAAAVAAAGAAEVASIGLPRARAETLVALAGSMADGTLDLRPGSDPAATAEALRAIRGIGPWTAQYVVMRALSWPDAFPASDLGLRRALGGATAATVEAMAEAWRPWRAYAAMLLWDGLDPDDEEVS